MSRRFSFSILILPVLLTLLCAPAMATNTPTTTPADPTTTSAADADASAHAAQQQQQQQHADGGDGIGSVYGDTSKYTSRSLSLAIQGMSAAPAVAEECLIHSRGMGVFGIGVTGGTRFDDSCMEDVRRDRYTAFCLQLADRYAAANMLAAFAAQMEKCGGVHAEPPKPAPLPPPAPPAIKPEPPVDQVKRQDLTEMESRLEDRMNRMFRQGQGK